MAAPESQPRTAPGPARRLRRAWLSLAPEQRLAAGAAVALWASMFLPWYGKSVTETVRGSLRAASYTLSAFGVFSFVEAAVLLVATSVLVLLFARAERRAFHLPGGDGGIILLAGAWTGLLIFYRMLDKPGTTGNAQLTATIGLQWGIFVALAAAGGLAYAGTRLRAAHRPEPTRSEDPTLGPRRPGPRPPGARAPGPRAPRTDQAPTRVIAPRPPAPTSRTEAETGQLTFDTDPAPEPAPPRRPRRRDPDGVPEYDPFGER